MKVAAVLGGAGVAFGHSLGAAYEAQPFELVAALPLQGLDQLDKSFWDIADPKSDHYLHHLSLDDLASIVGSSVEDIATVKHWFAGLGATTITVSPMRDLVTATFAPGPTTALHAWSTNGLPLKEHHPISFDYLLRKDTKAASAGSHPLTQPVSTGAGYTVANIKDAYGIPADLQATNKDTLQMVWGPGTFGYSKARLENFKQSQCPLLNLDKVKFDTANHGEDGGDNYGEGNLDVTMITSFGLNVTTLVSNTNTSMTTEEGLGFGQAFLSFVTELASRPVLPQVLSLSLGSLSPSSCNLLCSEAVKKGHTHEECVNFLQQQRQVCMYISEEQTDRINSALQILGARGVTIFSSSGDGGSHFSFDQFSGSSAIARDLNEISCKFQFPVFPTSSPYVISVGGESWAGFARDPSRPVAWSGSGGGFGLQFNQPEHQKSTVAQYIHTHGGDKGFPLTGDYNAGGRAYPDLSAVGVQGTSQSSPLVAGIFSLIIDHRLNKGLPPLGFLAPRLWQVNEAYPGVAFEDIITGNSKTSCATGFPATKGWDPVTGWGRPKWAGLLEKFGEDY